ncbi:FmdB family zinc ribbon protein [Kytococcus sedentarius]|uniref:FmdB family zinc ribbon protein n=1 Tax=Kytococcus sedentarius TaxID=1276 RepID=UPI00384B3974
MPLYEVRCEAQHVAELSIPLAAADEPIACPDCGADARRLLSSPRIGRGNDPRARLIESTRASAHAPQVVDAVPPPTRGGSPSRPRTTGDPRHAKLPRP